MTDHEYADHALRLLRSRGFRITRGRRLVLESLWRADRPVSPYWLRDEMRSSGEAVDIVSIYRTLETLERNGLAHRIASLGGYLPCRLHAHPGCHHHLICRECRRVDEVDCPGMELVECSVAGSSGYRIERHIVEFVGLCPACSQAAGEASTGISAPGTP